MRTMKDSGIEWIGQIPEEWNIYPTKRFFRHTKTLAGEQVDLYERLALTMNGVIKRSKDDSEGLQPERFDTYQVLRENELVFKLIDLANVKTSRVGLSPYTGIVSPAYIVLSNKSKDNRFFYFFFMSMYYNEIFNNLGDNGVRSSLNAQDLLDVPMVSIPVETQSRIADFLDEKCGEIDRYIEKQQQIIEKLKAYKQAVITEAVTKGLDPTVPMKDSGIEWIGMIPAHWNKKKLKYATTIMRGKFSHRPRNDPDYYDGQYPFVQTGDVARAVKYISEYSQTLNGLGYSVSKEFPSGTIVMTIAANVADVAILSFNACFPDSVVGFVPQDIEQLYLFYMLKAMKQQLLRNAIISTQLNLNIEIIKEEFIPIPPIEEQQIISNYLDTKFKKIDDTIDRYLSSIKKLTDYKKSLIYEAVTGKREV